MNLVSFIITVFCTIDDFFRLTGCRYPGAGGRELCDPDASAALRSSLWVSARVSGWNRSGNEKGRAHSCDRVRDP